MIESGKERWMVKEGKGGGKRAGTVCCVILIQSSITPGFAGAARTVDTRLSESG